MSNRRKARSAPPLRVDPGPPGRLASSRPVGRFSGLRRRRWLAPVLLGVLVFAALRGVHALQPTADTSAIVTDHVVVVGVAGRPTLTATDRTVLAAHLDDAQAGVVSTRARYVGTCATAGWTTLGAGRRAAVDYRCDPTVSTVGGVSRVDDWSARLTAAAADRGDAQLGTLAGSVPGCVAAVGPDAAVAAARPDGTVAAYEGVDAFLASGLRLGCPVTLVDAGAASDQVITALAARTDLTLVVTGVGPAPGSADRSLGVFYRLGTTLPGFVTSASTRREGVITLTDLTRTLIDFGNGPGATVPLTVDGSPLAVDETTLSVPKVERLISEVAALSDAAPVGYVSLAAGGTLLFLIMVVGAVLRRWRLPERVLTLGSVLLAGLMLTGSVPWARSSSPGLVVSVTVWAWITVLTFAAIGLSRWARTPAAVAGAALSVTAFTVDAALGGPMQPGSLINSRPIFGLRWYGFGNVTFGAYAGAALVLAGWVAHRLLTQGRRRAAVVAVAAIGFVVVACEGWPSMGTDFGGVIALTPAVVWFCLVLSGVRVTWPKLVLVGASAVVAITAISLADWSRGPDRRSHLGNFVQRVIDGDAVDVVNRKAVASAETVVTPFGVGYLVLGVVLWVVIFRYAVPELRSGFTTLRPTLLALLVTAVLGTLLNDGGIYVWVTCTAVATTAVGCMWAAHRRRLARPGPSPVTPRTAVRPGSRWRPRPP